MNNKLFVCEPFQLPFVFRIHGNKFEFYLLCHKVIFDKKNLISFLFLVFSINHHQLIGILSLLLALAEAKSRSATDRQLSANKHRSVKKLNQKSTKSPKTTVDAFKGLSDDDYEFIRQVDKQFKKFGNNLKIKVQKENRTQSKNIKRTIDGSLGFVLKHCLSVILTKTKQQISFFISVMDIMVINRNLVIIFQSHNL